MKSFSLTSSTVFLVSIVPSVLAWGASGHQAVGFIAQEFLAPNALEFVTKNLGEGETLGEAATWADTIRHEDPSYAWSAPLHYIDAKDDPPNECSVSEDRDCADGRCVLTAIANYTTQVVDEDLPADQLNEALKFLSDRQFIGDVGQPLHVENFEEGGNGVDVKCSGADINLHALWDSGLIDQRTNTDFGGSVSNWVSELVTRIKTGDYSGEAGSWVECSSTTTPTRRSLTRDVNPHLSSEAIDPLQCPHTWAVESNFINCQLVFSYGDFDDLCTTNYYTDAIPLIEHQLATQGVRLAAWLNVLFDGQTHFP